MKAIDRTDCGGKSYRQDRFRGSELSTGQIPGVKATDRTDSGVQSYPQDRFWGPKISTGPIPGVKDTFHSNWPHGYYSLKIQSSVSILSCPFESQEKALQVYFCAKP